MKEITAKKRESSQTKQNVLLDRSQVSWPLSSDKALSRLPGMNKVNKIIKEINSSSIDQPESDMQDQSNIFVSNSPLLLDSSIRQINEDIVKKDYMEVNRGKSEIGLG